MNIELHYIFMSKYTVRPGSFPKFNSAILKKRPHLLSISGKNGKEINYLIESFIWYFRS